MYITIYPAGWYNLPCFGVNCNSLGHFMSLIIPQMCIRPDNSIYSIYLQGIYGDPLTRKQFRSVKKPTRNIEMCCFFYN